MVSDRDEFRGEVLGVMGGRRATGFRVLAGALLVVAMVGGAAAGWLWWRLVGDLPDFADLADYRPPLTSRVFDRSGRPIAEFYEERRELTPLSEVPQVLIDAFVAAEDDKFFEHDGVDYVSILRAAWANLRAGGETVQGASTITQQTVKQLLLSPEQTYERKLRELILARRLEQRFSKQDILFLYLNQIYFGSGAYGVGEAALTYFGKPVGEIDAGEAALLAGLPKAPGRHSPFLNPERAEERRRYVLDRMREEGYLDEATWRTATDHPPELRGPAYRDDFATAAYFAEEVRRRLVDLVGNERLLRGGLRVETTLDLALQAQAISAVRAGVEAHDRRQGYRGPLRKSDPKDLAATLTALALENGLAGDGVEPPPPDAPPRWPESADEKGLLGVVVSLEGSDAATVAFAPESLLPPARVGLESLAWARPAGDEHRWEKVERVAKVLQPGDVARFRVDPQAEGGPRAELFQEPEAQAALLSFEIDSGAVRALVGGYDFAESEFDRATQARRQPGSAFKPLVYAAAVEAGFTPASTVYDRPVVFEDPSSGTSWRPENYGRRFLGAITLREALARSVNNASIHLLEEVGVRRARSLARRLGIDSPLEPNLGIALGVSPVTLLEITRAYAAFAAGGEVVEPVFVTRVLDRDGNVLVEQLPLDESRPRPHTEPALARNGDGAGRERAMPADQAYLAAGLLRDVVEHPKGTGRRARSLGHAVGGKTGTTNDGGDAWFVGFTPDVATGVWVGFDEKRVLGRGETGGRAALPIWMDYMQLALRDHPRRELEVPEGIVFARIDAHTGELATHASADTVMQAFIEGSEPQREDGIGRAAPDSDVRLGDL